MRRFTRADGAFSKVFALTPPCGRSYAYKTKRSKKNVNSADVFSMKPNPSQHDTLGQARDVARDTGPLFDLIELFFFAYRDFVGDADRLLERYRFGRAHHRVLHFVSRQPGLTVAELLDILKITKQSLNRVMKDLLDTGYVEVRAGVADRRQRLLYATVSGRNLAMDIARLQTQRFSRAFAMLEPQAQANAIKFLTAMIDPDEREKAERLVRREDNPM